MPQRTPPRRSRQTELAVMVFLGAVLPVWAHILFQDRMLIDGAGLATFYARGDLLAHHFLYLPVARLLAPLAAVTSPGDPIEATRLLSAVAYGVGAAFTWLFASEVAWRGPGVKRDVDGVQRYDGVGLSPELQALAGTLLVAFAPAALFFATAVEVHALSFATVSFAAWATLKLPWRVPALATVLAALLFALAFWAHQLHLLLGPGFVLLCGVAARWAGKPLSRSSLVLGVGPALLAGAVGASALANRLRTGSWMPSASDELDILSAFHRPPEAARFWWDGWLLPLSLAAPALLLGLARGSFAAGVRVMLSVSVLVPTAFLFAWGVSEHGGYLLGQAPFLAALIAGAVAWMSRAEGLGALGGAVVNLVIAVLIVRIGGRGFDVDHRAELIEEHLAGGTFVATAPNAPSIKLWLPDAVEFQTEDALARALAERMPA